MRPIEVLEHTARLATNIRLPVRGASWDTSRPERRGRCINAGLPKLKLERLFTKSSNIVANDSTHVPFSAQMQAQFLCPEGLMFAGLRLHRKCPLSVLAWQLPAAPRPVWDDAWVRVKNNLQQK
jgi:hypothetical protein